jgi:integrase
MAWLEEKPNGKFHVVFRFSGQRIKKSLGTSNSQVAQAGLLRLEENIGLIERGRLLVPEDADIAAFLLSDGQLNGKTHRLPKLRSLKQFRNAFFDSIPAGSLEESTLAGMRIHLDHLRRVLGASFSLLAVSLEDLQRYVDSWAADTGIRGKPLSPATIKKELTTLRSLWNWARNAGHVNRAFPSRGLRYPKASDKPPFQTWGEINRKIEAYRFSPEQQAELWGSLFLTTDEIEELLADVKKVSLHRCIYPMFVFAAYTGARRSEILRSRVEDIDFTGLLLTIHEKKRVRERLTTRSVPLSPLLFRVLQDWIETHPGYGPTFSLDRDIPRSKKSRADIQPLTRDEAQDHFKRTIAKTKWSRIRGWHVFRHSFCSNCAAAGIDQRVINAWVGHQTEEMVKRYRHLIPNQQQEAIAGVFKATATSGS